MVTAGTKVLVSEGRIVNRPKINNYSQLYSGEALVAGDVRYQGRQYLVCVTPADDVVEILPFFVTEVPDATAG